MVLVVERTARQRHKQYDCLQKNTAGWRLAVDLGKFNDRRRGAARRGAARRRRRRCGDAGFSLHYGVCSCVSDGRPTTSVVILMVHEYTEPAPCLDSRRQPPIICDRRSGGGAVSFSQQLNIREQLCNIYSARRRQLVAWHSGRTSVSGRRTFPCPTPDLQLMGDHYCG